MANSMFYGLMVCTIRLVILTLVTCWNAVSALARVQNLNKDDFDQFIGNILLNYKSVNRVSDIFIHRNKIYHLFNFNVKKLLLCTQYTFSYIV